MTESQNIRTKNPRQFEHLDEEFKLWSSGLRQFVMMW